MKSKLLDLEKPFAEMEIENSSWKIKFLHISDLAGFQI